MFLVFACQLAMYLLHIFCSIDHSDDLFNLHVTFVKKKSSSYRTEVDQEGEFPLEQLLIKTYLLPLLIWNPEILMKCHYQVPTPISRDAARFLEV